MTRQALSRLSTGNRHALATCLGNCQPRRWTHLDVAQLYTTAVTPGAIHGSCMALSVGDWSVDHERGSFISRGVSYGANLLVWGEEDDGCLNEVLCAGAQWKDVSRSRRIEQSIQAVCERVQGVSGFAVVSCMQLMGISVCFG